MKQHSGQLQQCVQACMACSEACLIELRHFDYRSEADDLETMRCLIAACAQICSLTIDFIIMNSVRRTVFCAVSAELCDACADFCREAGDMDQLAGVCRGCAVSCGTWLAWNGFAPPRHSNARQALQERLRVQCARPIMRASDAFSNRTRPRTSYPSLRGSKTGAKRRRYSIELAERRRCDNTSLTPRLSCERTGSTSARLRKPPVRLLTACE